MPNIFSDHFALILTICFDEETARRGPDYWRFNNSLLSDNEYVALLLSKIPEFVEKYKEVEDKGLFWEMVKMEMFAQLSARINDPKEILNEERNFFKELYSSRNVDPNSEEFSDFFNVVFQLPEEMASTCEGEITLAECTKASSVMQNNKSPGSDGLTTEFYPAFWDIISTYVVNSFNYAFNTGNLPISQRQGIISLIPKKEKDTQYLKNWRPVSLLNVDYKIATKTIALRIEKVLPYLINPTQTVYVKGRFIGESIRLILDIMEYTKHKDIPGVAVFLDFEKAFHSVEWNYIQKCLETTNFGPHLRQWVYVFLS